MMNLPRRPGGQPGNQNARKHGFYSNVLSSEDRVNLRDASDLKGLNEEIALLRARLKSVLKDNPENARLISELASALARLMRTNQKCGFNQADESEAVRLNALTNLGRQFGFTDEAIIAAFSGHYNIFKNGIRSPEK